MDDLIKRIAIGQVWPKAIAAEYADTLTPRQVTMLYEASNVCYEVKDIIEAQAAEIADLRLHMKRMGSEENSGRYWEARYRDNEAEITKLREALKATHDDLLMRAERDAWMHNGEAIVAVGNGVWHRINAALQETANDPA